ncbi:MAG TPA: hypothetical protein PLO68_12925, partial [Sedimentisphaerales bacterium]|nr:hypothetical protein [Sedimentisphaerales bacterium]
MLKTLAAAGLAGAARPLLAGERPRFSLSVKRLTLKHTWTIARNSSDYKDNVFVRIERDGVVGWGEAAPNVRYGESAEKTVGVLEQARPLFESSDWFEYVDLRRQWETFTKDQTCAGAALDMAVLDWVGRKLNVPLYQLLGLDGSQTPVTTFSIGIDTPDVVRQKVREAA